MQIGIEAIIGQSLVVIDRLVARDGHPRGTAANQDAGGGRSLMTWRCICMIGVKQPTWAQRMNRSMSAGGARNSADIRRYRGPRSRHRSSPPRGPRQSRWAGRSRSEVRMIVASPAARKCLGAVEAAASEQQSLSAKNAGHRFVIENTIAVSHSLPVRPSEKNESSEM